MNIYVEFSNKDSVKKLGCKWDQEKKSWQCPYSNTDSNIKALIAMQDDGTIGFKKGIQVNVDDKGEKGFLFDVDLEYPEELHDLHNGYALASENQKVKTEWLSEWQSKGYKESNIEKLITSFFEKKNYGINYRLLKLFLALGLKLKKVNRVLEFDQEPFMKS